MSKILVVEPRKILQQAIRLALCPDHEVQLDANLSDQEPSAIKNFDLAIIDAAALRDVNVLGTQLLRAVQKWKIPKIWIDEAERVQAPGRDKLMVLTKPIQRETLQSAVATCLGAGSSSKQNGTARLSVKGATGATAKDSRTPAVAPIIELVDVVEEPPERKSHNQQQRKTK
jgi:hypothetical protein